VDFDIGQFLGNLLTLGLVALVGAFLFVGARRMWLRSRGRSWEKTAAAADKARRCPECGYDLRATPHQCPECGVVIADRRRYLRSLGHDWPANPIEPVAPSEGSPTENAMVDLCSTDNPTEADLLYQQLTARGVRCVLNRARSTQQSAYDINVSHHVRVAVRAADERLAREYLCRAQGIPAELLEEVLAGERKVVVA
jgi:predicted RNA-binding Zn-ribbon protein involved in translation (DUF1610 family)